MDLAIALITPERMRRAGAAAFDMGWGLDDHGMPLRSSTAKDWQAGYLQRELESRRQAADRTELVRPVARQQVVEASAS